jgi:hypothetical protein
LNNSGQNYHVDATLGAQLLAHALFAIVEESEEWIQIRNYVRNFCNKNKIVSTHLDWLKKE